MIARLIAFAGLLFAVVLITAGCQRPTGQWDRMCQACHDGKTILNGNVVIDKEQLKTKYKTIEEFVNACGGSPQCMNILKHNKTLLEEVGKEIGIKEE